MRCVEEKSEAGERVSVRVERVETRSKMLFSSFTGGYSRTSSAHSPWWPC